MKRPRRCALALALFPLIGCGPRVATEPTAAAPVPPVAVTTAPVQLRSVQRVVTVVGTLAGYDEALISPKVDGRVLSIEADVGDIVIPGSVLLRLDPTDLKLEVDAARRALEAELARLGLTQLPAGALQVEDVPSVRRAEVALINARAEFGRVKSLAGGGSASRREYDTADLDLKTAEATKRDVMTQAEATLAAAKLKASMLESAQQKLADATVCAPIPTGWPAWAATVGPGFAPLRYVVAQRMLSEGELVRNNPVTNAFRLVINHTLKLRAAVPEQYASELRVGQLVELRTDASDKAFQGRVARINPTVETTTRTFQIEVTVPNPEGRLKAGGFARGSVLIRTDAGVRTVPPGALVTFAGVTKVFQIDGGRAKAVEVRVGARERDWLEVLGPLPDAAAVATSGFTQLVDGSAVVVR